MSGARRISLAEATTELAAGAPDGFRAARLRIGPLLGARRTGASLYEIPPGQAVCHQIRNDAAATARVLIWSEVAYPGASGYPDSGKVGVWSADRADDLIVRRSSAVDYYDGEV